MQLENIINIAAIYASLNTTICIKKRNRVLNVSNEVTVADDFNAKHICGTVIVTIKMVT